MWDPGGPLELGIHRVKNFFKKISYLFRLPWKMFVPSPLYMLCRYWLNHKSYYLHSLLKFCLYKQNILYDEHKLDILHVFWRKNKQNHILSSILQTKNLFAMNCNFWDLFIEKINFVLSFIVSIYLIFGPFVFWLDSHEKHWHSKMALRSFHFNKLILTYKKNN